MKTSVMYFYQLMKNVFVNVGTAQIPNSDSEKLLEIKIDWKINFKNHIRNICKKPANQIKCFHQSLRLHESWQKRLIINALFSSRFAYCPQVWMLHSRESNHKANRLRERCRHVVYTLQNRFKSWSQKGWESTWEYLQKSWRRSSYWANLSEFI